MITMTQLDPKKVSIIGRLIVVEVVLRVIVVFEKEKKIVYSYPEYTFDIDYFSISKIIKKFCYMDLSPRRKIIRKF